MVDLNINVFNIIIISGVVYGFIFSGFVISQKVKNTIYLALVVLFLSLSNLQYWIFDTNYVSTLKYLRFIFIPWQWLILPMFFLYVANFIGKDVLTKRIKFILFSPFFFVLFLHILQLSYKFFVNSNYEIPSHFERGFFAYIDFFSIIFNIVIMIASYKMIKSYEDDTSFNLNWVKSETGWLKTLIQIGLIICFCWFIAIAAVLLFSFSKTFLFYFMWILMSLLIYWIGHTGLNKSEQLEKRIEVRQKKINSILKNKNKNKNNSKSFNSIKDIIENKKIYLNPKLSLSILSEKLNLSESHISRLVKQNTELSFTDYVNKFRIEEAMDMLKNNEFDKYNIEIIGLESGFNTKTSFFNAFKKFTGMTPNQFKKAGKIRR